MGEHVIDRTELLQERYCGLLPYSFATRYIIRSIAHETQQIDNLLLVLQSVFIAYLFDAHQFETACVARPIHEHMLGDQLRVILVRRSHIDFKTGLFALHGERTDDIVCLKTGYFKHGYIHRLQQLFDDRNGFADIFGCLGSLRFVLLIGLMAERTACRIKSNAYMSRVDFLEQVFERDTKTEDSGGVFSLTVHSRGTDEGVIRPKDHGVRIYKKQFFHVTS